ncbi:hypothetical protein C4D60_Mb07t11210 [Musa balbisiana]|uniref:Uncharacterized protein n=1 Tax=Musa balbisiana TaxID=52838 RepID=A0A4S8JEH8_MUSBA|nr:hypothetical protein C4D60_Mb07t11210 [Musa balbisiana]
MALQLMVRKPLSSNLEERTPIEFQGGRSSKEINPKLRIYKAIHQLSIVAQSNSHNCLKDHYRIPPSSPPPRIILGSPRELQQVLGWKGKRRMLAELQFCLAAVIRKTLLCWMNI